VTESPLCRRLRKPIGDARLRLSCPNIDLPPGARQVLIRVYLNLGRFFGAVVELNERLRRRRIITVIEFLSPTNKRPGAGQEKYLEKQADVLRSDASLVEIDLVRSGQRVLALPAGDIPPQQINDYPACVRLGWKPNRRELYALPLRQRLPILPIPLRPGEDRVEVDLQAVVDQTYAAGRYDKLDYSLALDPPLPAHDAAWAEQILREAGKR
jgi:Protein of unknown function (DUF4058)